MPAQTKLPESDANGPRGWQVALMTGGTVAAVALLTVALAWNSGWGRGATDGRPPPSSRAAQSTSDAPTELVRWQPVEEPHRDLSLAADAAGAGAGATGASPADLARTRGADRVILDAGPMVVYVVASEEQAAFLRWALAEQNEILKQLGQRQVRTDVLLVNAITTEMFPQLPGAPGTRFIDLRTN